MEEGEYIYALYQYRVSDYQKLLKDKPPTLTASETMAASELLVTTVHIYY